MVRGSTRTEGGSSGTSLRAGSLPRARGLGPASGDALTRVGVTSIEQLRRCDPFDVYARLKRQQSGLSLNMLYALIGAVEDRDWREVARTDRTSILMRLDDMGLLKRSRK
jgi:DNA transformation protein